MLIKAGSNSRLTVFEDCKYRAKLAFVDRVPEPPKPPRADGKEDPMERGLRIHKSAEAFVKGETPELIPELSAFETDFNWLKEIYENEYVLCEESWNFDHDWQPIGDPFTSEPPDWDLFNRIRFRIKADLVIFDNVDKTAARVVDIKTGRRYGNEVKHGEQLELYAIGAFIKFPQLQKISTELWYTDLKNDNIHTMSFTKTEAYKRLKAWDERNKAMINCTDFPPNPTIHTCKWCPYRADRSGHCSVGIY